MSTRANDVDLALLGPLTVTIGGQERQVTGPIRRALLAVLALHPSEVVGLATLSDLVWSGIPPPTAEAALRVHVSQLRQALGRPELIERVGAGYRLAVPPHSVDLVRFEEHARAGRQALVAGDLETADSHLTMARDLWRGAPLADLGLDAGSRAEQLHSLRSELAVDLAELDMRTHGAHAGTSELSALTVERPFDERVWRLLITAEYWAGRQADALETYRRAVAVLDDELGIEPTAALRRLQQQILQQDPALDPPAGAEVRLPTFATSFVGRAREIDAAADLLGRHRLVTLTGLGGVGKTRLGVAVAERVAPRFRHGVVFVSFEGLDDGALVPGIVAAALGSDAADVEQLAGIVQDRELLLLLDNCEPVVAAVAALVSPLLIACGGLRILATSRVPLNVVAECVQVVTPLALSAGAGDVPESVRLFLDRVRLAAPGVRPPPPDDPAVHEAVTMLGGVPLAIELAAARCSVLTVADVVSELGRTLDPPEAERDRPERHHSMEAALAGTLEHLSPAAGTVLGRLAAFRSPVGIDALQAVAADDAAPVSAGEVASLLGELVQAAVVQADLHGTHGRYWLLPPVRTLAPAVLDRLGQPSQDLSEPHLAYVEQLAGTRTAQLSGPDDAAALAALDEAGPDLRAALRHAALTDPQRGLGLAAALGPYWMRRRMHSEGRRWLRRLLDMDTHPPADLDPAVRGAALHAAGALAWDDGDRDDAEKYLGEAWQIRSNLGDEGAMALTLNNLAGLASDRGDHAGAYERWREAHRLFRAVGHDGGVSATQVNLGIAAHKLGRRDDAIDHLETARRGFRERGATAMQAMVLERLAGIYAEQGDARHAMTLVRAAQTAYEDVGTPEQRARLTWQRALRHRDLRELDAARAHLRTATRAVLADDLQDAWWVAGLIELAAALAAPHAPEDAGALLGAARAHREDSGHAADAATVPDLPDVVAGLGERLGSQRLAEEMTIGATRSVASVLAELAGLPAGVPLSART